MSDSLYSSFESSLMAIWRPPQPIVVAYSGGLDSTVLLHLLASFKQRHPNAVVSAAHVHHGLSANADSWLIHCQKQCERLAVPFAARHLALQRSPRQSLEALARKGRYQALAELTEEDALILLGQHQDDQLETLLLQLKRGAGPKGLSGMGGDTTHCQRRYARLLLNHSRAALADYAACHQLDWIEDESNQNPAYERNFLRNAVIPLLRERWPSIGTTVSRSARLCAQQQALLDEVAQQRLKLVRVAADCLDLQSLADYSWAWQQQIIRLWLQEMAVPAPSELLLHRLPTELFNAREDAQPCIQWDNWQFRRFRQRLYIVKSQCWQPEPINWLGEGALLLPDQRVMEFDLTEDTTECPLLYLHQTDRVQIRFGEFSHSFTPADALHSKPLKQWFKFWSVPPWLRDKLPLVFVNDRLAAVPGYAVDQAFSQPQQDKSAWRLNLAGSGK
ncbi:tRNA lysidine(34) synthetase TilS [Bowmanella denitrificans]|uniref:tRNA lysidine(34) synthetase TilS n=1 Tax=Bowmanella denitrificans TaxID=366582 RepID=UPI000C9C9C45|nr:tRNA lysidine(34) synthetase TilS [Bowmanella denitrificans]